jgi:hypothetical protein
MDQRTIVAYLELKGLSPRSIHQDLVATLGGGAMADSTVARYIHDAHCSPSSQMAAPIAVPSGLDDSDEAILSALDENPFASVRQLSRLTHIPATTVHHRLTESLGFPARHLRWVPHALSEEQRAQRVELSRERLRILQVQVQRDRAWHDVVTLDESWFSLSTDHGSRIDLASTWWKSARTRTTHSLIEKVHADNRLESAPVPLDQRSSKRMQIQQQPWYHRNPLTAIRMAFSRRPWTHKKIDSACW